MADNVIANTSDAGGATFRTDDDGTAHWPYTKIAFGADNTQTIVTSTTTNPLPVALSDVDNAVLDTLATQTTLAAINTKLASGTVIGDVNLGVTDAAVLVTINTAVEAVQAAVEGTLTVGSHAVTATLAAETTKVIGTVNVAAGQTIAVTGTVTADLGTIADVATQTTLAAILVDTGQIETLLTTIDADTSNITACNTGAVVLASGTVTAVTDITNAVKVIGNAAEDAAVSGAPVLAAGRYDSTERATETGDVTTLATSAEGWMMVGNQSSYLFDGVTRCQIKRVSGVAASDTTAIVAAVVGKKIRILALSLLSTSATVTNVHLATTTDLDVLGNAANPIPIAQDADGDNFPGFVMPYNQGGWTETSTANEDLNLILSAAQDVIYALTYIEVD